jgi:anti-sigma factor RsiW
MKVKEMKERHVIAILESAPFAALSDSELSVVRAHIAECAGCQRAYEAARVSSLLLKERAAEVFEPSPFFQTRVLAALRERQAANAPFSFARLWKATGALVASMAAAVALLAGLTFVAPSQATPETTSDVASVANPYTVDDVILNQSDTPSDDVTYDQVLTTIYDQDDDNAR